MQEGYVVQRSAALASMEDVRQHLLSCSLDSHGAYPQHVAVMRLQGGVPKLLTRAALGALCQRMAAELEAGEAGAPEHTPCVLQVGRPGRPAVPNEGLRRGARLCQAQHTGWQAAWRTGRA